MSSKKRKNPTDNSQSAVTAVSALAARRRLAEPVEIDDDEDDAVAHRLTPSNAFSALRGLKRIDNSSPLPKSDSPPAVGRAAIEQLAGSHTASPTLNTKDGTVVRPVPPKTVVRYSSFVLNKRNSSSLPDGGLELRLQDGERFMVAGIFGLRVLSGCITIQGASLRAKDCTHWVYASYIHAIPVIRTHQETCLHLLSKPSSGDLQELGSLSPLYSQIWRRGIENQPPAEPERTFELLFSSDDYPRRGIVQELVSPPAWNKKLASSASQIDKVGNLKTLICGPKSAGKSTMSRLLVNRLLTRGASRSPNKAVAVLDIDPGQPEYGPPGTLSLVRVSEPNLGVPFSHPGISDDTYTVVRSHALAAVTPASNPGLYRDCTRALYSTYKTELADCPLIINTPGWIQGTGLELLTDLISHTNPHEVLYMSEEGPTESVDALQDSTTGAFTAMPSQPSELTARTAAELRDMQFLSYFHAWRPNASDDSTRLRWLDQPVSHMKPIVIPYAGENSIQGILSYDYQAPVELLADSINGMILALVGVENPAAFGPLPLDPLTGSPETEQTPEGLPYLTNPDDVALNPQHSRLLGLVLIRGVDANRRCLYGLSPAFGADLGALNNYNGNIVLVHGNFGSPNWAYTESLHYAQMVDDVAKGRMTEAVAKSNAVPWVEVLENNQSRPVGSRRWRVRRDLGRGR